MYRNSCTMYRKSGDFLYNVQQLRDYVQLFLYTFFILYTFRFPLKCTRISLDSCTMYRNINKNQVFFVQCTSFSYIFENVQVHFCTPLTKYLYTTCTFFLYIIKCTEITFGVREKSKKRGGAQT